MAKNTNQKKKKLNKKDNTYKNIDDIKEAEITEESEEQDQIQNTDDKEIVETPKDRSEDSKSKLDEEVNESEEDNESEDGEPEEDNESEDDELEDDETSDEESEEDDDLEEYKSNVHYLNKDSNIEQQRADRRKRRKRNQTAAYLVMTVFILMIIGMVFATVYYISGLSKKPAAVEPTSTEVVEGLDDLIGTEETLVKPDESSMVQEMTPEEKLDEIINAAIEVMPIEDKVAGLFMVTPEAITNVTAAVQAGEGTQKALTTWAVGGLVYFKKNIQSADQLKDMLSKTSLYSRYPVFIAVDEEGGTVSRLSEAKLMTNPGSAQTIGATQDPANAYNAGQAIATSLKEYGFNVDLAPVADINNIDGSAIGDRSFGSDSSVVSSMVTSMTTGLEDNGVSACLKHFPGIGNSTEDTHAGMAGTQRTAEEFRAEEFAAFKAGIDAGADFIMVSHLSVPAFTGDNTPCSLSKVVVTDILRNELGYNGIIITDAMNMRAITEYYEADEAAIMALKSGCDMILMPDKFDVAYAGVLKAVQEGTISEERINDSLRRIYRVKYADKLAD